MKNLKCIDCGAKEVKTYMLDNEKINLCKICSEEYYFVSNVTIEGVEVLHRYKGNKIPEGIQ